MRALTPAKQHWHEFHLWLNGQQKEQSLEGGAEPQSCSVTRAPFGQG